MRGIGKITALVIAVAAGAAATVVGIPDSAQALGGNEFDPGNIISDANFYDSDAMTESQIQSFLVEKGSGLQSLLFDVSSRARSVSDTTGNVRCEAFTGGTQLRASTIIFRAQTACGISAKVILVTLQKEQGLITRAAPSQAALDRAMGMACPDTAPCAVSMLGFGNQVYEGSKQLNTYKASNFGRQPGLQAIPWHPNAGCGSSTVLVENYATAALYNYTPYQPNAAALANLRGTGDGCSSYGNRNFWVFYGDWFDPGGSVPPPGSPSAPIDLKVSVNSGAELTLTWLPPSSPGTSPVTDYVISYTSELHPNPVVINDGVSTATTFTSNNPTPGLTFTLRVRAVNEAGVGAGSSVSATIPPAGSPSPPMGLEVTVNNGAQLTLSWSPPVSEGSSPVTDYVISYTSALHPNPVVINDGVSTATTFTSNNPTPGLTFTLRVQAKNAAGVGPAAIITATPPLSPTVSVPSVPTGLQVTVNNGAQLTLSWSPPVSEGSSPVTDYVISYTSALHPNPVVINDGVSTATTFTSNNPTPGLTFTLRVQAKNAAGVGPAAIITATPPLSPTVSVPSVPTGLQVTVNNGAQLTLSWSPPVSEGSSPVTDYVISYTSALHPNPVVINDGVSTATTFTSNNPTPGLTFTLRVQAKNAAGVGPAAIITATPPLSPTVSVPSVPTGLQVTVNNGAQLTLSWSPPVSEGSSPVTDYVISYTSALHPNPVVINDGVSTATTFTSNNPTPGLTFTLRVQAKNAAGVGPAAIITATPPLSPTVSVPSVPTGLQVTVNNGAQLTLSWSPPVSEGSSPVTDYVISYTSALHPNPVVINDGVSTATTFTSNNPTPGLTFTLRVQAKNAAGVGPAAIITATPPT